VQSKLIEQHSEEKKTERKTHSTHNRQSQPDSIFKSGG
jgi:hypothetical protein